MPVYFVRAGESGPVKVGYVQAGRSVERRLVELQVGNHEQLHLLALSNGGPATERKLHRALAWSRVRGEWFKWSPMIAKLIDAYLDNPDADLFNERAKREVQRRPVPSSRTLRRRAAKAAFARALEDGSMTIRQIDD